MKIVDVKVHLMAVPGPDGRTIRRNWLFVEVNTDEGVTGFGEATTEYHELAIKAHIESELRPRLIGRDPTDIESIWQLGYRDFWWRRGIVQTSAISGIDQALWDIAGKAAGLPVFKMLGGRVRDRVQCYARADFAEMSVIDAFAQAIDEGFTVFKHTALPATIPFDADVQVQQITELFYSLHAQARSKARLAIDCHGWFDHRAAYRLIENLRPLNLLFVEEPMEQGTIEPYVRLKQAFPDVSIAAGERWMTRWDCREWLERQAIDICQVDICHTGGISELMRIGAIAEMYNIQMAPHNPYGPVAMAASAHASAAMANFCVLEHCRLRPWYDRVQTAGPTIEAGHIHVDDLAARPGLGVELDMELIAAHDRHKPLATVTYSLPDGARPLI